MNQIDCDEWLQAEWARPKWRRQINGPGPAGIGHLGLDVALID